MHLPYAVIPSEVAWATARRSSQEGLIVTETIIRRRSRRGVAFILALFFLVIFASMAVAVVSTASSNLVIARNRTNAEQSQAMADGGLCLILKTLGGVDITGVADAAGMRQAIGTKLKTILATSSMLNANNIAWDSSGVHVPTATMTRGDGSSGQCDITLQPNGGATTGNIVAITCVGRFGGASRSITYNLSVQPAGAGLIILDPSGSDVLLMGGTILFDVETGIVQVNSNNRYAVKFMDNARINADELDIVGGYYGASGQPFPIIRTGVAPVADPLAGLPVPANGSPGTRDNTARTFTPGYYTGGISIGDGKTWTFQPGLYVVDNGISFGANSTINGDGVIFVVKSGFLHIADVVVNFTPPTSGTYAGLCFFQPLTNTSLVSIGGHIQMISGMLYAPTAQVNLGGSYTTYSTTQVICFRLKVSDAAHLSVPLGPRRGASNCFYLACVAGSYSE
jgi:hypothetical protein